MKFNPDEIKEATKADFDAAWNEGKKIVSNPGINEKIPARINEIRQTPSGIRYHPAPADA